MTRDRPSNSAIRRLPFLGWDAFDDKRYYRTRAEAEAAALSHGEDMIGETYLLDVPFASLKPNYIEVAQEFFRWGSPYWEATAKALEAAGLLGDWDARLFIEGAPSNAEFERFGRQLFLMAERFLRRSDCAAVWHPAVYLPVSSAGRRRHRDLGRGASVSGLTKRARKILPGFRRIAIEDFEIRRDVVDSAALGMLDCYAANSEPAWLEKKKGGTTK